MTELQNYHYKECGLDYVWLRNGVIEHDTGYGKGVAIPDIDGLHQMIGLQIIERGSRFIGAEIRFLRHELDLSQKALAGLLGSNEQTFARWETDKVSIPGPAQYLLASFYRESVTGDADLQKSLKRLSELDAELHEINLQFEMGEEHWKVAA